ncbi:hypothetical protein EPUS_06923 [Endocarpon pusillum Z07020]|uniref:Uncharacterized protein n=1 Tax=Endocarpon pusillum (strain Z07020 / HMAS-L-300199) TaxID=1263415 RepID=U1FTM7_ENDPU|nr:uncharacterized protein EPUS_06923 [Endocarpon pusillum Z07020]ERF68112.1 hypothetical protein EPUS_06923 [Endocarpon pusillum Z07020]
MAPKLVAHRFRWGAACEVQHQLFRNPTRSDTVFDAIGTNDDLISLATAEKVVPIVLEVLLSEFLVDLLLASNSEQRTLHLENAIRHSWHEGLTPVVSQLMITEPGFLPYSKWLSPILAIPDRVNENPAKKLARFFAGDFERMAHGEIIMGTGNVSKASWYLRCMNVIDEDLIAAYVARRCEAGFSK